MFLLSLENVALLLAMAIPGFIIAKLKMIKKDPAVNFLSIMLLYVCQPFITINSFLNTDFDGQILLNLSVVFVFTAVLMSLLLLIGRGVMFFDKNRDKRGLVSYAGAMGNVGYMCIPFLKILMPANNEVILYATASVVAFNLVCWTLGNYMITGDKKFISLKKAVFNPPFLSFIIVLPLFILNINFVRFEFLSGVNNMCRLFADMVGPLSMTLLGVKFADMRIKDIIADYRVYIACGIKLILSPVLGFALLKLVGLFMDTAPIALNIIALAAMPCANNIMMFCSLYNKDTDMSARLVLVSTVLSVITIPLSLQLFL